jgi:hypothetical protein
VIAIWALSNAAVGGAAGKSFRVAKVADVAATVARKCRRFVKFMDARHYRRTSGRRTQSAIVLNVVDLLRMNRFAANVLL